MSALHLVPSLYEYMGMEEDVPSSHLVGPQDESNDNAPSNSKGKASLQGEKRHSKKRRGADRENITLGGLKKVEIANKRRAMQRLNKKLGEMDLPANRETGRKTKKKGPPPPTISVCFIDNTADGKLVRRMQRVEEEVSDKVNYR